MILNENVLKSCANRKTLLGCNVTTDTANTEDLAWTRSLATDRSLLVDHSIVECFSNADTIWDVKKKKIKKARRFIWSFGTSLFKRFTGKAHLFYCKQFVPLAASRPLERIVYSFPVPSIGQETVERWPLRRIGTVTGMPRHYEDVRCGMQGERWRPMVSFKYPAPGRHPPLRHCVCDNDLLFRASLFGTKSGTFFVPFFCF